MPSKLSDNIWILVTVILAAALVGFTSACSSNSLVSPSPQSMGNAPAAAPAQSISIPAFPGAEGWGATAVGGRGGRLYEVTNLNDSGPGSLRLGAEANIPRTIVFRVAGVIELKDDIRIKGPYITIAGQTAPGSGVTLRGGRLIISTHNVIIRYLRFRGGAKSFVTMRPWNDLHDVIIDHCSASGGEDDIIDIYWGATATTDMTNITVQNCLIAEAHARHPTSIMMGGDTDFTVSPPVLDHLRLHHISAHHNYFAHNGWRNPLIKSQHTEVINNVVYNWSNRIGGVGHSSKSDWINNYFKPGPMSRNPNLALVFEPLDSRSRTFKPFPLSSIYIAGNILPSYGAFTITDPNQDNWLLFKTHHPGVDFGNPVPKTNRRLTPLAPAPYPVTIAPALTAVNSVVQNAGANQRLNGDGTFSDASDEVDQKFIADFFAGTGLTRPPKNITMVSSIDPGTPYTDTDKDGMADTWENLYGFNPNDPSDGPGDADSDGYTNLEEFLNGSVPASKEVGPTPAPTPLPMATPISQSEVTETPKSPSRLKPPYPIPGEMSRSGCWHGTAGYLVQRKQVKGSSMSLTCPRP